MRILVTGANGMIGAHLVKELVDSKYDDIGIDRESARFNNDRYFHQQVDLADKNELYNIVMNYKPDRIIHLAALAHAVDGKKYTWENYKHLNVECAKNVFDVAGEIPILFISTVDVFGFTDDIVNANTPMKPVSDYGKSKMIAELEVCKKKYFDIFRLSPVYTDAIKRDIQKRYYLKYPNIAYQVGKGTEYEILNVKKAVKEMVAWCARKPQNTVKIIKDEQKMWTPDYIKNEKMNGRAKIVIWIPYKLVRIVYVCLKWITGENKYTYLLNKVVNPLKSE